MTIEFDPRRTAIIIPTYNEGATIANVIDGLLPWKDSVFVIDGNSTDDTRGIAEQKGIRVILQKGRGKGAALRQALAEVDREIIVFIDGDGSHESTDIPRMVEPILLGQADMVVGSRYLGGSDELHGTWNNFVRMVGSSLVTLGINYRWSVRLTDVENGFRAVRRDAAVGLRLRADDFTIEQEMVMKALKNGLRVREIASHEYERAGGASKLPTRQGWRFIAEFLKDIW